MERSNEELSHAADLIQLAARAPERSPYARENWAPGPWDNEPDRVDWVHAGLACLIVRAPVGALCGYVGVGPTHPWYHGPRTEKGPERPTPILGGTWRPSAYGLCALRPPCAESCDHTPESLLRVHGGITYSGVCQGHICHVTQPGMPEHLFWYGFDCGHFLDVIPGMDAMLASLGKEQRFGRDEDTPVRLRSHYRDVAYVTAATNELAEQLAAVRPGDWQRFRAARLARRLARIAGCEA